MDPCTFAIIAREGVSLRNVELEVRVKTLHLKLDPGIINSCGWGEPFLARMLRVMQK
jgi:hypothetical protein